VQQSSGGEAGRPGAQRGRSAGAQRGGPGQAGESGRFGHPDPAENDYIIQYMGGRLVIINLMRGRLVISKDMGGRLDICRYII
jgi:hypothetical protein